MFERLAPEQIRLLLGKVTQADPLKIQTLNDEMLVIPKNRLVIPEWLTCHKYKAYIQTDPYIASGEPSNEESHDKEIDTGAFICDVACPVAAHPCTSHQYKAEWIIIKNCLEVDDVVVLLSFDKGKRYYILDRIGREFEEV